METSATATGGAGSIGGLKTAVNSAKRGNLEFKESAWKAAKKVEAAFLGMLLKEMRKTVHRGDLFHGGPAEEMFQGRLDDAYVESFEEGPGAGIAQLYFGQLMRRNSAEAAKARGIISGGFIPLKEESPFLTLRDEGSQFVPLDGPRSGDRLLPLEA